VARLATLPRPLIAPFQTWQSTHDLLAFHGWRLCGLCRLFYLSPLIAAAIPTHPNMGMCGICHYVAPPDGSGHTARTCPLRQTLCRHSLPADHPFHKKGQCGDAKCIHLKLCGVCGLTGHQYGTQTYALDRWQLKDGRLLRKTCKRDLDESDFVCVMMKDETVKNLVDNTQSVSAAASEMGAERRRNVSRLRANTCAAGVGLGESIKLLQSNGSQASVLHGSNKVAFDALVENRDEGAVKANRRAANAVESDVDGGDDVGATEDESTDNEDRNSAVAKQHSGRGSRKGQRGPPGGRMGLYAAAISKAKSPAKAPQRSTKGKGKAKAQKTGQSTVYPLPENETVAVNPDSLWPTGTRGAFSAEMPFFYDKAFGSSTPLRVAHMVIEQMCHCPVADADPELASALIKGALATHVRGYSLMSGTLSAAQVAEWLCSGMPPTLQPALLSSVALAVETLVRRKGKLAASPTAQQQSRLGSASGETEPAAAAARARGSVVMDVDALQEYAGGAAATTADTTDDSASAPVRGPSDT